MFHVNDPTMGTGRPEISHISILGSMLTPMKRGSLRSRTGNYGICTDYCISFLSSPFT